jgi:hypothetical protein
MAGASQLKAKKNIIYFLPRNGFFNVAFVFGDKAVSRVNESNLQSCIKTELSLAKKLAEGRRIGIDVKNEDVLQDIKNFLFRLRWLISPIKRKIIFTQFA